ncbi:MAG: DsbE family thiol:disulfide interchange protein [Legionellales bacterium]|nr:DsbE family thiol:disulfide interchange protein [Legionellales bacterium]
MRMPQFILFIPLMVFIGIGIFLWRGLQLEPQRLPSTLLEQPLPEFQLPDLLETQQVLTNHDLSGQYSLLNVWASWCYACRAEHSLLLQLARQEQIPIYGLNYKDAPLDAVDWLQQLGNPYTAIGADHLGKVAIDLGVYGAPETFLIDGQGIVRYRHVGVLTSAIWQTEFLPRIEQAG